MVLSRVESSDAPPIADPSVSTGHVHPIEFRLVPPPVLVVVLSESKGVLYVAARDGSDPLGPATNGWLWVLTAR